MWGRLLCCQIRRNLARCLDLLKWKVSNLLNWLWIHIETGFQENPFRSVKLLELDGSTNGNEQQNKNTQQTFQNYDQHRNVSSFNDYEMLVMRQLLSQEEEQKRLF